MSPPSAVPTPKDCDLATAIWVKGPVTIQSKRSTVAPFFFKKKEQIFQRKCQKGTKLYLLPGVSLNARNHVFFKKNNHVILIYLTYKLSYPVEGKFKSKMHWGP